MATRKELIGAVGERYRTSSREEKAKILDEFIALTGCHRKPAIRALNRGVKAAAKRNRKRLNLVRRPTESPRQAPGHRRRLPASDSHRT